MTILDMRRNPIDMGNIVYHKHHETFFVVTGLEPTLVGVKVLPRGGINFRRQFVSSDVTLRASEVLVSERNANITDVA